ncbi:hypothetical protein BV378_08055 [Nostoc sp. RF31YmG]|nr:hypothetical protein BV378_08055 [Nostoc sp. RF31YmG]
MENIKNIKGIFPSNAFQVIEIYKQRHRKNSHNLKNSEEYKDFINCVQKPFVFLCERLYQNLHKNLANNNFYYINGEGLKEVNIELLVSPSEFRMKKYIDNFSLLYVLMTEQGIEITFHASELLFKINRNLDKKTIQKNIANIPSILFYKILSEGGFALSFNQNIVDITLSKLINKFDDWFQEIKPLFLMLTDINSHQPEVYTLNQCAEETGCSTTEIKYWLNAINRKGQAIICGSPGVGKTFIAERLAKHLLNGGYGFLELVQFHPAYTYEDFIQGIRPQSKNGKLTYPLVPGRFLEFCKKAEYCQDTCVLIIDEINRANLAQVFGELMYLLEYRDKEIPLAGGNTFRIPKNVRIIGTMNTADRSIALIDHALRRRFAFIELRPNYDVLRRYHQKTGFAVEGLINILQQLNQLISDKNYEIGISFFFTDNLREDIEDIWRMEIEPYLEEYFFNQPENVENFRWDKIKQNLWM